MFCDYSVTYLWIFLCNWSQIYWGWRGARGEWARIRSHLSHDRGRQVFPGKNHFQKKLRKLIYGVNWTRKGFPVTDNFFIQVVPS